MVSKVLRIYPSFDDEFHRPINGQTYDAIGRFRLTFGQRHAARQSRGGRVPTEAAMDKRRKSQRFRALKAGMISFNQAGGISCRVRNMSPVGACLEVASQVGIPDNFVLVISYDKLSRPCQVIWRAETRIGVAFDAV
jgi:PilZ domain